MTSERISELRKHWCDGSQAGDMLSEALDAVESGNAFRAQLCVIDGHHTKANFCRHCYDAAWARVRLVEKEAAGYRAALEKIHGLLCGPYGVACQCAVVAGNALEVKP